MSRKHTPKPLSKRSLTTSRTRKNKAGSNRFSQLHSSFSAYLTRRPHRSFRLTRRRDYARSLVLPGYWSLTAQVVRTLWADRKLFGGMVLLYSVLGALLVGLASQDTYDQLSQLLTNTGEGIFAGGWGSIGQAGLLLYSGVTGSLSPELTDAQQVYAALIFLLTWLTTVWLLRAIIAGKRPRLRDGLYNAGAPIVGTAMIVILLFVQLLPATLAIIVMNSAMTSNLFESGLIAMVVSLGVALMVVLSVYLSVSTFIALIIITLPGMYPWQAVRTAGDIVIGRRIRLLLRLLWLGVINFVLWLVIMLPTIVLTRMLSNVFPIMSSLPIVPVAMTFVGSVIVVWSATYVYILYRKVVEDDAQPA